MLNPVSSVKHVEHTNRLSSSMEEIQRKKFCSRSFVTARNLKNASQSVQLTNYELKCNNLRFQ